MYYLIIFFWLFQIINPWKQQNLFTNFKQTYGINNLRNQLILKTQYNGDQVLVIFGGYSIEPTTTKKFKNDLFLLNLSKKTVKKLAQNKIIKPSARYDSCGLFISNVLFIYGGNLGNKSLSNQLWKYQFSKDSWIILQNYIELQNCQLLPITIQGTDDTISIVGIEPNSKQIKIYQYSYYSTTNRVQQKILKIYDSVYKNLTLWDGTSVKSYFRVLHDQDLNFNTLQTYQKMVFTWKYFCLLKNKTNNFLMVADNGIYSLQRNKTVYELRFVQEYSQQQSQSIDCLMFQNWLFFVDKQLNIQTNLYSFNIFYKNLPSNTQGIIHSQKVNFYPNWIKDSQFFQVFGFNNSIYIVNSNLQVFSLNQKCQDFINQNPNFLKCTYGMYSCKKQYTGSNCLIQSCYQTIRIYDTNNLIVVNIQCSGNGQCQTNGCSCQQNWTGEFCQIYSKTKCKSELITNFIASNCQCSQPNVGGNYCDVVFCYNDCTGKGKCNFLGVCECIDGYKGPDCSIQQINFDLI